MSQRRTLGEILVGLGRITESDVTKALEYQRHSGGYFGEALVACSLVTEDEIEWGLASQFDLPYVFPRAEEIDYEVASMVSAEWALANLTLPILRTADSLTVVVESPIKTKAVDELRARTHLDVQLALASPSKIRELVRQVHARAAAADEDSRRPPVGMSEALDFVLAAGAPRFGVSVRGPRAWTWWDDAGTIRRRLLSGDWLGDLTRAMDPDLQVTTHGHARRDWSAELRRGGPVTPVDVHYLADESGQEYVFRPRPQPVREPVSYAPPPEGIVSEVRLLARSGAARFVVTTDPPELGHEILPYLPTLLLDPSWRSIYVHTRERAVATEAFSHRLKDDPAKWREDLDSLRVFQFDVATLDLAGGEREWMASALDLASVAFLRWSDGADPALARESGIRWHLHVARRKDMGLDWSLEPLAN
jgi:type IV pilus assembly protein PilB